MEWMTADYPRLWLVTNLTGKKYGLIQEVVEFGTGIGLSAYPITDSDDDDDGYINKKN